jgi:hypothetical protein
MPESRHFALVCVLILTLSHAAAASAQERSTTFGTFRASLAAVDNARDNVLDDMGFQLGGSVGRPLAPGLAGVVEVAVTTVSHHTVSYPCAFPGCSGVSRPSDTGLSLAPGFQWYTIAGSRKVAFTVTPGVVWFVSQDGGTRTVVPKVGARFDVGWVLSEGPRFGLGVGVDWWGSGGTMPRWALPFGITVGLR